MPSAAMQDLIDFLRDKQKAGAGQAPATLEQSRAAFAPAGRIDVILTIGEGLPHVYPIMLGTPEAAEATEQTGTFLRARVRSPGEC